MKPVRSVALASLAIATAAVVHWAPSESPPRALEDLDVGESVVIRYDFSHCFCAGRARIGIGRTSADEWSVQVSEYTSDGLCKSEHDQLVASLGRTRIRELDLELLHRRVQTSTGCTSVYTFDVLWSDGGEHIVDASCQEYAEEDEVLTFSALLRHGIESESSDRR